MKYCSIAIILHMPYCNIEILQYCTRAILHYCHIAILKCRKYAKWKAAYINECIKNGQTPIPGPVDGVEGVDELPDLSNWQTGLGPAAPAAGNMPQPGPAAQPYGQVPQQPGPSDVRPTPAPRNPPAQGILLFIYVLITWEFY